MADDVVANISLIVGIIGGTRFSMKNWNSFARLIVLCDSKVQAIYREFWECKRMLKLVQIYEEAKYDLLSFLRLHKIVRDLGMKEHDIQKLFELAKNILYD